MGYQLFKDDDSNKEEEKTIESEQIDSNEVPKVLLIGKIQQGKSSFIQSLSSEKVDIAIGDGNVSCTKTIKHYPVTLRNTSQKIVFVDTPGLD